MKRWYERIKRIGERIPNEPRLPNYLDEVYAFFQNCHHLKDWIMNDDAIIPLPRDRIEEFINKNECMCLCADLCNGSKHLKLTKRPRSNKSPVLQGMKVSMKRGQPKPIVEVTIRTETGTIDAFELASHCIQKWERFIKKNVV